MAEARGNLSDKGPELGYRRLCKISTVLAPNAANQYLDSTTPEVARCSLALLIDWYLRCNLGSYRNTSVH